MTLQRAAALILATVILASPPAAWAAQDEPPAVDARRLESVAARYHQVLLRQPRGGTTFDLLYRLYLDAGRGDDLAAYYRDLTRNEPDNDAAFVLLGLVAERRGRDDEAVREWLKAEKIRPADYYAPFCRARVLAAQSREGAVHAYERALANEPPRSEAIAIYKALGRLHSRQGRLDEARKAWDAMARRFPDDRFAQQELAEMLAEEGRFDEAIAAYRRLGELTGRDPYQRLLTRLEIGQVEVRQGKLKSALATFDGCLEEVEPDSWMARDIHRRVEEIFQRSDDLTGLAEYYRARLRRRPDDLSAMVRLAATLGRLGQHDASLAQYRAAIKVAPGRKELREALVAELVRREKFAEALAESETVAAQAPRDIDALRRLGELHLKAADPPRMAEAEAKAVAAWHRIAEARPTDAGLAAQAGELCRQAAVVATRAAGRAARGDGGAEARPRADGPLARAAVALFEEAVRRAPEQPQYRAYLGECYSELGRDADALSAWRAIADPPRDNPDNLRFLAETLAAAGLVPEATAAAERASSRAPDRTDLHALAAELLARARKFPEALEHVAAMERPGEKYATGPPDASRPSRSAPHGTQ